MFGYSIPNIVDKFNYNVLDKAQAVVYNGDIITMKGLDMTITVTSIYSTYPLGTTDGTTYTVTPRR